MALSDGKMCLDMKFNCLALLEFSFLFICISQIHAQQSPDSILYKESAYKIHQVYLDEIGDNAQIYHGSEFIRNGQKAIGFPFYESDSVLTGSVCYQGMIYMNLNLFYNLVSNELITNNYAHDALVTLAYEKVDSFSIGNHSFIRLAAGRDNGLIKDGFYEQLFSGEPAFYARREKRLVTGAGSEEIRYIQFNYYFIKLKNVYYQVEGKNSLLEVLKDRKDVLKKYIRSNKLNFKKNPEPSLLLSTIFYSQLKH
jgi:hypothetical protein